MDDIDYFRAALRQACIEAGGQSNVALDSHLSEPYISQIISGKRVNPSRKTLAKLADALKTTYQDMVSKGRDLLAGQGSQKNTESGEGGDYDKMKLALAHIELLTKNLNTCEQELAAAKKRIAQLESEKIDRAVSG